MIKILIITNKSDLTSDLVVNELFNFGRKFYRFNTEDLISNVKFTNSIEANRSWLEDEILDLKIPLHEIRAVYYRRPELPNISSLNLSKEENTFVLNEYLFCLEGIYRSLSNAYWFNDVYSIRHSENKMFQLRLAKEIGLVIPKTLITNDYNEALKFYKSCNEFCIVKPLKSGQLGKNSNKVIFTSSLKEFPVSKDSINSAPLLLQEQIDKKFDIRTVIVGASHFSAKIHSQENMASRIDWRASKSIPKHSRYSLSKEIFQEVQKLMQRLDLRYCAVDFVIDFKDNIYFLEINPNGQWAWIENQLGYPIAKSITKKLISEVD